MPVTPVVNGSPVRFVATPEAGVPIFGVTNVGELDKTIFPVPVVEVHVGAPVPAEVKICPLVPAVENAVVPLAL